MREKKSGRIDSLQALRILAFGEIFLCHCEWKYMTGALGVAVFIMLSGFCMQLGYDSRSIEKLSWKQCIVGGYQKIAKLYPLHILMLLYVLWKKGFRWNPQILSQIFLLQSWCPDGDIFFGYNGVAWYLSTYLVICVASPFILAWMNRCKETKQVMVRCVFIFVVMILVAVIGSMPFAEGIHRTFTQWLTYICPLYRFGDFTVGVGLAILMKPILQGQRESRFQNAKWIYTLFELGMFVLVAFSMQMYYVKKLPEGIWYTVLFMPVSAVAIYLFARKLGFITKWLTKPLFIWLGNMSGYMFLIHQVCIGQVIGYFREHEIRHGYYYGILLSFVITLAIACVYRLVYDWLQKRCRRR